MKNKKQLEKAVGELYIMIHHLNEAVKLIDKEDAN
jgi:hypothetical protein